MCAWTRECCRTGAVFESRSESIPQQREREQPGLQLLCAGGADVKMVSATPKLLNSDQPHDARHFSTRHRGCLSTTVGFRDGGSRTGM